MLRLVRSLAKWFSDWGIPILILVLGVTAFTWNHESVFFEGNIYFTDGDCYARMTRVRMLQEHPFQPVHHHAFENYPDGTRPHTTSPLDYLILLLSWVLRPFVSDSLSMAGAWVSPILGIATLGFLTVWSGRKKLPYRNAMLLLVAVSPILAHGFLLGRPDHQSLLIFLIGIAWIAETEIWTAERGGGLSAVAWALALWVSLFEPLILLGTVLLLRLATRRLVLSRIPSMVFASILAVGFLVDGLHVAAFDSHFATWSQNIGELRHASLPVLFSWGGWLVVVSPLVLLAGYFKKQEPVCLLLCILVLLLTGLCIWYVRWGYFFALALAFCLPWVLPYARWKIVGWGIFVISLWPVAADWEHSLFPDDEIFRARVETVADQVALHDAAIRLKGLPLHGVMAPWWFSPAIVWWAGQPCVAGTSHQSLPGIVDASEFFLSEGDGRDILQRRQAGYIVAYEPERVVSNAARILTRQAPSKPLVERLYDHPRTAGYPVIYTNRFFKVFGNSPDQK